jgi:hypothetical protein
VHNLTSLLAFTVGIVLTMSFVGVTLWKRWSDSLRPLLRTALAITVNWLVGTAYVQITHDYTPWYFNIVIDGIAAYVVMRRPASKVQGYIGLFYIIQICYHVGFGIRTLGIIGEPGESTVYYDIITLIAWAQLMAMGMWCSGIWRNALIHRARDRRLKAASEQSLANSRRES